MYIFHVGPARNGKLVWLAWLSRGLISEQEVADLRFGGAYNTAQGILFLFMYIYIGVLDMSVQMQIYIYICIGIYVSMHLFICLSIYVDRILTFLPVHCGVSWYALCSHIYIYTHMYIYIHIHIDVFFCTCRQ